MHLVLSESEIATARGFVDRMELEARRWPRNRMILLMALVFNTLVASGLVWRFFDGFAAEHSLRNRYADVAVREDMPPELWHVAELRRSVALLEIHYNIRAVSLAGGVLGLMVLFYTVRAALTLRRQWNQHVEKQLFASVLRQQLDSWSGADRRGGPVR